MSWLAAQWPGADAGDTSGEADPGEVPDRDPSAGGAAAPQGAPPPAAPGPSVVRRWLAATGHRVAAVATTPVSWTASHWPGRNYVDDDEDEGEPAGAAVLAHPAAAVDPGEGAAPAGPAGATAGDAGAVGAATDDAGEAAGDGTVQEAAAASAVADPATSGHGAGTGRLRPRRVPLLGLRQVRTVAVAVYGALADPLVGGDRETRERRAARARRVGMVTATTALAGVLVYAIFPIRAFLDQWEATNRAEQRLDVLTEGAEQAEERIERLQDQDEVERIAREEYGLIYPDEESYPLLPAPEERDRQDEDQGSRQPSSSPAPTAG